MTNNELNIIAEDVIITLIVVASIVIYFLPSIIAKVREHSHTLAIFFLNLFTGATGVG